MRGESDYGVTVVAYVSCWVTGASPSSFHFPLRVLFCFVSFSTRFRFRFPFPSLLSVWWDRRRDA
jgi:hypothetical protein